MLRYRGARIRCLYHSLHCSFYFCLALGFLFVSYLFFVFRGILMLDIALLCFVFVEWVLGFFYLGGGGGFLPSVYFNF